MGIQNLKANDVHFHFDMDFDLNIPTKTAGFTKIDYQTKVHLRVDSFKIRQKSRLLDFKMKYLKSMEASFAFEQFLKKSAWSESGLKHFWDNKRQWIKLNQKRLLCEFDMDMH